MRVFNAQEALVGMLMLMAGYKAKDGSLAVCLNKGEGYPVNSVGVRITNLPAEKSGRLVGCIMDGLRQCGGLRSLHNISINRCFVPQYGSHNRQIPDKRTVYITLQVGSGIFQKLQEGLSQYGNKEYYDYTDVVREALRVIGEEESNGKE